MMSFCYHYVTFCKYNFDLLKHTTMITLYREKENALADEIQEGLRNIVIAHEVQIVTDTEEGPYPNLKLPILVDEGKPVNGEQALKKKVKELGELMELWDLFKSDACYVDKNVNTCED